MINCIAIDDEPLALELLAAYIKKIDFLNLKSVCSDAFSANNALQNDNIDLIFMDVEMPGISGIQFIESLSKKPMVIVVSAHGEYALECYALDVIDYLMKPFSLVRFMKACNKAKEIHELKTFQHNISIPPVTHTYLNAGYSVIKIKFDEVLYIEGLKDYVKIHFSNDKKPAVIRVSFKSLESHWPNYFMRVHKSFIINSNQVEAIKKSAILIGGQELPLGDTYRSSLTKLIDDHRV